MFQPAQVDSGGGKLHPLSQQKQSAAFRGKERRGLRTAIQWGLQLGKEVIIASVGGLLDLKLPWSSFHMANKLDTFAA